MASIKVSIVVPVYNVSRYIERCVQSIINQSYSNFECILVDDRTPDDSTHKAEKLILLSPISTKFEIVHHNVNKGLSVARNTGTIKATGDYVFYLDSDDEIPSNCIYDLVVLANKYTGVEMIQGNTMTLPTPQPKYDWRNILYKNYPEFVSCNTWIRKKFSYLNVGNNIPMNAWNKMIKRSFIVDNKLLFKEGIIHEDELWMFQLTRKLKSMSFLNRYTYLHYINQGSIMQTNSNYRSLQSWGIILDEILGDTYLLNESEKKKYCRLLIEKYKKVEKIDNNDPLYSYYQKFKRFF